MLARVSPVVLTRAWLLCLYVVAAFVGRASVLEGGPLALVWPAAGVAVAWFVTEPSTVARAVGLAGVAVVGGLGGLASGASTGLLVALIASHLVGVAAVLLLLGRWAPGTGDRALAPLDSPQALFGFLTATGVGCAVGVGAGVVALGAIGEPLSGIAALAWWGRNVCSVVGVGVTTLMLIDRFGGASKRSRGHQEVDDAGRVELAVLVGLTAALVVLDYLLAVPVTFLLPATTVWAGMRFSALTVSVHTLAAGAANLWLALVDRGPFAGIGDVRTGVLLSQLFVAMTFVVGLVLVAMRARTAALQADLIAQERDQHQELLTFAHRVAHDLRTPLTVVDAWTDELALNLDEAPLGAPPGAADALEGIARASVRMRTLVDDLLADAIARERVPEHQDVDLADVVAEVAREHDAETAVHTAALRPVRGDPVLIRQLVENLLGNALKYVRPDQEADVTVSARRTHGGRVLVSVADRGMGIPEGAHEWVFEPFRRAHHGDVPGTGLGLSTCRRIVERHGGSIRALARPDGPGTVIEFDLMGTR